MSTKPKEQFSLDEISRRLEAIKSKDAAGKVSFSGFEFNDIETVLLTAIEWNESLSAADRQDVAFRAPFEAGAKAKITKDSLLAAVHSLESGKLGAPATDFTVVSTLSLQHGDFLKRTSFRGVEFSFHDALPKEIDRKPIQMYIDGPNLGPSIPARYTVVCGKTSAKSPDGAVSRVLSALDTLRGAWNLVINRKTLSRITIGGGTWEAVNRIRLGPVHTAHRPDGQLAVMLWWLEPCFAGGDSEDLAKEWPEVAKAAAWCLRRTKRLPYSEEASAIWSRYTRALDRTDLEASFLRLWGLLEMLTGTSGERYDETIKRTLFICEDREFHRLILEHLRDCRNALVHRDEVRSDVDRHTFQLKRYVEELIRLHLACAGRFKSLTDFGEFLSLPFEPVVLKQKMKLLARGLAFRTKTLAK